MNKVGFMSQLEGLLAGIPSAEREEALQYYNDYFEDAGPENEQAVIKSLGSPREIAENIKMELKGEAIPQSVSAGEHAITKYGQVVPVSEVQDRTEETRTDRDGYGEARWRSTNENKRDDYAWGSQGGYGGQGGQGGQSGLPGKSIPGWGWIAIILGAIIIIPGLIGVLGGVFGGLFGLLVGLFALVIGFGAASIGILIGAVTLAIVSFLCLPFSVTVFCILFGIALLLACFGILVLMLVVWICGKAVPGMINGAKWLWEISVKEIKKLCSRW